MHQCNFQRFCNSNLFAINRRRPSYLENKVFLSFHLVYLEHSRCTNNFRDQINKSVFNLNWVTKFTLQNYPGYEITIILRNVSNIVHIFTIKDFMRDLQNKIDGCIYFNIFSFQVLYCKINNNNDIFGMRVVKERCPKQVTMLFCASCINTLLNIFV